MEIGISLVWKIKASLVWKTEVSLVWEIEVSLGWEEMRNVVFPKTQFLFWGHARVGNVRIDFLSVFWSMSSC